MEKTFIEPKYNAIKEYFKSKKYDKEILNTMCMELIDTLGELTFRGIKKVDGQDVDLWKMRVWVIIEKSGNLPEYKDEEVEEEEIVDTWYTDIEDYD